MSNNTISLVATSSMLIGPNDYERTLRDIQLSLQSSDEKNIIVCASTSECDSVCGVRILQASASLRLKQDICRPGQVASRKISCSLSSS